MTTKMDIRESIIELNFYLLKAMQDGDTNKVKAIRLEINELIDLYLKK